MLREYILDFCVTVLYVVVYSNTIESVLSTIVRSLRLF